ncbi:MAG: esterase [Anaerolineaceae bacterium]|nr:esterase [Anaerolineaceae bacterium]
MTQLITTLGPKTADELGMILPHEHVFVDLRTPDQPGYAQADPQDVVRLMTPEIERARQVGVTAIVECSTVGVGRRADIDRAVSEATGMPLVVPTGVYREPWVPDWEQAASEDVLAAWMLSELQSEIEHSGVQAAWIKLSAGDEGITDCEAKILRAAARAARETNAVIGSHTVKGRVVRKQLNIVEEMGYTPSRFIWIHTQAEPDYALHLEMAKRGAWLEFDWIGNPDFISDEQYIEHIQRLLDGGFEKQILLSMDRGWYDPAQPGGGTPNPYTYLSEVFLPKLRAAGVDEEMVRQLTVVNPFMAFAR